MTLKDVSKASGLSLITVSRALRQPETVHADTRAKIQATIDELGYIPNLAARSLVSQRSDMIGVVVPILASSLFADFAEGVSKTLEPHGQRMLLAVSNWSPEKEEEAIRTFIARQADGIILTGFSHTEATRKLLERFPGPVVEAWNKRDGVIDTAVGFDNHAAAVEMTQYLIGKGYREIVMVGGSSINNDQAADRTRGFVEAMKSAGREVRSDTIVEFENPATIESGGPILQSLMARPRKPDAVFFLAELPAQGAMLWALSHGISVPQDVAIAGFGDLSLSALLPVPMTTVQILGRDIGEQAATKTLARLQGAESDHAVLDVGYTLKLRSST
ncbi:LacI family DNA-binding transcriptional regulator [Pseudoruegeria sp. SHC-113]|uniref:LacI family DNA-binding transcriptional regulator n=1 Tax=Pseudoruegeria sp. SHC-113 TaxID=2855439 RepID=UPI0021BB57EB|nr:LacI family DNA-binding transcriptional regulator [Pseudoruegeria sp. SHC-113]MCT8158664.1 LacI family DNA-binding transcriptional regulator [Pseudoruegeria sp. SHC-113]